MLVVEQKLAFSKKVIYGKIQLLKEQKYRLKLRNIVRIGKQKTYVREK